jgi:hypothetical protein
MNFMGCQTLLDSGLSGIIVFYPGNDYARASVNPPVTAVVYIAIVACSQY